MKTDQFITILARQAGAAPNRLVERRLALAVAAGAIASAGAAIGTLGLNGGLAAMGTALAIKMAYGGGLMLGSTWLADRVSRPGTPWRVAAWSTVGVLLAMALFALTVWTTAPADTRAELLLGRSWASCPWRVAALSVPALVAMLWAMRGLAPTRPRLAGFTAGVVAGSLGALGYALYCPELSPVFVWVWYTLGILVPAGAGAAVGPRLLSW